MRRASRQALLQQWSDAWPEAISIWSQFTQLSDPLLCDTNAKAKDEGLTGSFAMIRLNDQSVVVDLEAVEKQGLQDYAVEILAHEIGHHILAPATVRDHFRVIARIRAGLPTLEDHAPMVANLYTDLLINDRLQRQSELRLHEIYQQLNKGQEPWTKPGVWALYMRIYELLWQLEPGSLNVKVDDNLFQTHAWLGARVVRVYANDWLIGASRFAALLLPYLHEQELDAQANLQKVFDTQLAGLDCEPHGLVEFDDDELIDAIHPAQDPLLNDTLSDENTPVVDIPIKTDEDGAGQRREPFEYGEILRAAGINLTDHEIAVRYYREAAQPYLIPFPKKVAPQSMDTQMEGLEVWEMGEPLDQIDWLASLSQSPHVIPGVSTMSRYHGAVPGDEPETKPIDLDIYIDSSGSMPNPQVRISYMALAGAVICISALRSGSRVKATLWSGTDQFMQTPGFISDEEAILQILTSHFGGATAFPIHVLRDTYTNRADHERDCHILHISDDGIDTLFARDEKNNNGWDIAAMALEKAGAGGTMALNLWQNWEDAENPHLSILRKAQDEQGWQIHPVSDLSQLVTFSREFSQKHYGA